MHWQLEVTFAEDSAPVKDHNGAQNLNALKTVLALLKQETSQKHSLAKKRKMAAWDDNYLFKSKSCKMSQLSEIALTIGLGNGSIRPNHTL